MRNHHLIKYSLIFVIFFLTSCSGSQKNCPPYELEDFLNQSASIIDAFQENIGQGSNHPEQKSERVEEMQALKEEYDLTTPPKCARNYKTLVSEAMQASLRFFSTVKDRYYEPFELAQFAFDKWRKADLERYKLVSKYLSN